MHPDYHVITKELARLYDKSGTSKATQLSINVIRHDLAEPAGRKTVLGRGKVFVVEQAELITSAAQNALLKTLEEPAGRTLIVLLTTHVNELLPTIRSRCQTIRFAALRRNWWKGNWGGGAWMRRRRRRRRNWRMDRWAWRCRWIEDGCWPRLRPWLNPSIRRFRAGRTIWPICCARVRMATPKGFGAG